MTPSLLITVPIVASTVYLSLLWVVSKHARGAVAVSEFRLLLALLAASSIGSVLWRTGVVWPTSDWALRLIAACDLLVAPTFLAFVAAQHATRWSQWARRYAKVVGVLTIVGTLTGAVNRTALHTGGAPAPLHYLAGYGAVAAALTAYLAAVTYLIAATRDEQDPFERNRRKFVGAASVLIVAGQFTNLVPQLQQLPLDRALNTLAAALIYYSLVRYRLFNAQVFLARSAVIAVSASVTAPLYLVVLQTFTRTTGQVFTPLMFLFGTILVVPAAALDFYLRRFLRDGIDRLFLGGTYIDHRVVGAAFVHRSRGLHSTRLIADLVAEVCQAATESRFTAVLLATPTSQDLQPCSVSGPDADIAARGGIRITNTLLHEIARADVPVTPSHWVTLSRGAGISEADRAEFADYRHCIIQPLVSFDTLVGLIIIGPSAYHSAFTLADLDIVSTVADQAGVAMENARLFEQLQSHAQTDFLTGLPNHRHLQDLFSESLTEAEATNTPFSVAMVDVDNFKLLNDTHGHLAGDEALRAIAALLRSSVRAVDVVGRYGGDEFLFILPGIAQGEARDVLARIMRVARRTTLATQGATATEHLPLRLSWGLATYPTDGGTARELISAADSDLRRRRYVRRRSGGITTASPSIRNFVETDPRRARIAAGLLDLLDARDPYTTEHSQQVAALSLLMADELRLSEEKRHTLWLGALLHDIGKLTVPEAILRKPGLLDADEWAQIRMHPRNGKDLLSALLADDPIIEIIMHHHERFDGSGYPDGLSGERIPLLVRAVSVADAYSAMVHDRPYRKGLSQQEALAELQRAASTQFDPAVVSAFVRALGAESARTQDARAG